VALLNPHFDLPFRLSGNSFASVSQDTFEDISNCVECIVRTPFGFRDDSPHFGFPQTEFDLTPLNTGNIMSVISVQEPRASLIVGQDISRVDQLITNITVEVG
jgi:hypothetical protein